MSKPGFVYFATNYSNTVIYTGVTSNLSKRIHQHKTKSFSSSFTAKYNIHKLVYFEEFEDIHDAIEREKQIKAGSRKKKVELINSVNPAWRDLTKDLPFDI